MSCGEGWPLLCVLQLAVHVSISPPTGRDGHRHGRKICLAKEKMEPSMFFRTFGAHTDLHYAEEGGALSRHRSGNEG